MGHHHSSHDHHEHEEPVHKSVVSWRWRLAAVCGNVVFGALELASGRLSSLAVTADGVHNAGDALTYHMQAGDVMNNHQGERLHRRRKLAHWLIAASSTAVGVKAGIDWAAGTESVLQPLAPYAAGGSLAMNAALAAKLTAATRREHAQLADGVKCHIEGDLAKHMLLDGASAAAALTGTFLQRYGVEWGEQALGAASGAAGAWMFRPTEGNLAHEH